MYMCMGEDEREESFFNGTTLFRCSENSQGKSRSQEPIPIGHTTVNN